MRHFAEYQTVLAAAAQAVGAQLQFEHIDSIDSLDSVFEGMVRQRVEALRPRQPRDLLRELEADRRAVGRTSHANDSRMAGLAEAGLLMTYGLDYVDLVLKAASYIDRVLKGPIQAICRGAASKFEMIVNLKTANALGLTVARSLLLRRTS